MRIAIDPVTGAIVRPSPTQLRDLGLESAPRSQAPLRIDRLADGSAIAYLDDRFMHYWVARPDSNGNLRMHCVDGPEAATRALAPATRPALPPKADR
jgi:hypothetical protein